jgi:hypothetical protein
MTVVILSWISPFSACSINCRKFRAAPPGRWAGEPAVPAAIGAMSAMVVVVPMFPLPVHDHN